MGDDPAPYGAARKRLGVALRERPERFDRTWESKARFSMDWFYPVLTGVLSPEAGKARLAARWHEFVEPGLGCRCVADQPWVTLAETCELTLALLATGQRQRAAELFSGLHDWRTADGAYWTGYQFVEKVLWPEEQPTWTAGAILLAADALTESTGAARLLPAEVGDAGGDEAGSNYDYEPEEDELLANLLPRIISTQIYSALLESSAAELAARMTAMDNATRNAGDMIDRLTLVFNRTRQAAITNELIEIISGAEAL